MYLWILLLLLFALYGWLTWRQFFWGILILAATLPSYLIRFSVFGLPTTVLEGMLTVLTVVWLWRLVRKQIKWNSSFFTTGYNFRLWLLGGGLLLLAATISALISPHSRAAWGIWKAYFIEPAILFLILLTTLKSKEEILKILWALILGCVPITLFALLQKPTGLFIPNPYWRAEATRRVTSLFDYPNALALYLAPLLPLLWPLIKNIWNKKRGWLYAILLALLGVAMIFSLIFARSTGALLAIAATTAIIGLWHKRSRYLVLAILIVGGLLSPAISPPALIQEVLMQNTSGQIHLHMWAETIEMLKERSFLGAGLGGYQDAVRPYHILQWVEVYLYPHNIILNFWTETGLLGLLGFIILVFSFFILPAKTPLAKALVASMIIILIHGLVDVPYFKNDLATFFWLLLGLRMVEAKFSTLQTS